VRHAAPPVVTLLQFRHGRTSRIFPKEVLDMADDTRAEVERAYQRAAAVVERHDLQHLSAYQLAGHIHRAAREHLAELADPASSAGLTPVDPAAMAAAEDHPWSRIADDPDGRDWRAEGRRHAEAGHGRALPEGIELHPRSKAAREFFAGYDEAKGQA
jgi:hypothetical protein